MWTEAWALWHRIVLLLTLPICSVGGEEYLIAFTKPPGDLTLTLSLILTNLETYGVDVEISAPQNTAATVPSPTQTTVDPGTTGHVALDSSLVMRSAGVFQSVVHVVSPRGEIAVQAFASYWQPPVNVQMSCLALPVSLMTQNYAVLTHCDKGYCLMAVLARHNNTDVTVTLELPTGGHVAYKGLNYTNGQQVHETLQAFEAMQLLCLMCDISGTRVTASKPVAVVAGADSYQVTVTVTTTPSGSGGILGGLLGGIGGLLGGGSSGSGGTQSVETKVTDLEYTMAQVPPLEMLRDAYILATTPLLSFPVLVKVKAFDIGTTITFFGYTFTAKADEQMWTFNISGPLMDALIADGPVLVGQFHPGHNDTFRVSGDETMFFPVPVSQWRKEYRLLVPALTQPDAEYVILVMFYPNQTNAEDCISSSTTIYSELVNAMRDASRRYGMYGPGYDNITGVRLQVQRQIYIYVSWSCQGNIGGYLYAYGNGTSWSVPLGLPLDDFIPVSEPTSTTTSEVTSDTEAVTDVTSTEPLTTTPSTETPSTSPSTPAKLLPTLPSDLSPTVPGDLPVSVPTDLPVSVPTDLPVSVPTDLPVSVPTDLSVTVPTDLAISVPAIPTLPSLPSLPPLPSFCPCLCRPRYQLEILANHTLLVPPEQYESELVVPKETLSSTRRKKTSAEDKRTSSSALGVYMTAIPVGLVMVLFYLDFCHQGIARIRAAYLKKKREKS